MARLFTRLQKHLLVARHRQPVRRARSGHWCHSGKDDADQETRRFPGLYDRPGRRKQWPDRKIHVILDNLSTHKKNDEWLAAHPNVTFHFTPTSASWRNQVEIWFGILSRKALAGASFASIAQLVQAIQDFTEVIQMEFNNLRRAQARGQWCPIARFYRQLMQLDTRYQYIEATLLLSLELVRLFG